MITVSKALESDLKVLGGFLNEYKLEETLFTDRLDQTLLLKDGNEILGFGAFSAYETIGLIDLVLIENDMLWPSMGDGLVKALLNVMDLRGIKQAYMLTDEAHSHFVRKIGLSISDVAVEEVIAMTQAPYLLKTQSLVYETKLPDFFDHACHSKK